LPALVVDLAQVVPSTPAPHNMKKGNFQSAAEGIAKHLKNHVENGAR
jgi:hypothetical protein